MGVLAMFAKRFAVVTSDHDKRLVQTMTLFK